MTGKFAQAAALLVGLLVFASGAYADMISVGVQTAGYNGGVLTTVVSGNGSASVTDQIYGNFGVSVSAKGTATPTNLFSLPEPELDTNTIDVTAGAAGTLTVYVTEQDITTVEPSYGTSFTINGLPSGWTITEQSYLDSSNALWGTGTLLGTCTGLTNLTTCSTSTAVTGLTGPYSETTVFTITAGGAGNSNDTINISAVPEPASLALFGSGLLGLAGFARRRFLK